MLPTALVKNEASKGFKGDSDSIKVKSFSSRTSSWLIAELIWGTSHIKISEATWGNLNREISSTSGGGSVVIRLINSDRISGLVKLKKKELNLLIKLLRDHPQKTSPQILKFLGYPPSPCLLKSTSERLLFGHFLYPPPSPFEETSFMDGP